LADAQVAVEIVLIAAPTLARGLVLQLDALGDHETVDHGVLSFCLTPPV
jgi:hypothetical protein